MVRLGDLGIDFEHWCFACGRLNPAGLHLDVEVSRDRAEARYVGEKRHEGYDGTLHGGVVVALLDEVMGWAIFHQGIWAVTGKLDVTFRGAARVGDELHVVGEITRDRGRGIQTRGTLTRASDGEVLAEAEALFLRMPERQRQAMVEKYSVDPGAFERVRQAVAAEEASQRAEGVVA